MKVKPIYRHLIFAAILIGFVILLMSAPIWSTSHDDGKTPNTPIQAWQMFDVPPGEVLENLVRYSRTLYRHWITVGGQNTRARVLISESKIPVTFKTSRKRTVVTGEWHCPYTGRIFLHADSLDIDHVVPLKEVHISGGYKWNARQRRAYANDVNNPETLVAVYKKANRSKGASDPAEWIPPNTEYVCEYLDQWLALKEYWNLTTDQAERDFIATYRHQYKCQ